MARCTILTIWNNREMFRAFEENLAQQNGDHYVLVPIGNADNRFPGARQAYNAFLDRIETEYVFFAHQDIRFMHADALGDLLDELDKLGDFGVAGVAGSPAGEQWQVIGNIVHGAEQAPVGPGIQSAQKVQSVDECLYIMRKETLQRLPYSDIEGWHLYAVEQCIRAEAMGLPNYVIPAQLWHLSKGSSLEPSYLKWLIVLQKKYAVTGRLNTTIKPWNFGSAGGRAYIYLYGWKQMLKQFLKKNGLWKGR